MSEVTAHNMEYNSEKPDLVIPEYGRNIQMLIRHTQTIEDPEMRQEFIERVIDLMQQMHPQNKKIDDYRLKLWKHVFRIAEYNLDVVPPDGEIPTPETDIKKPDPVPYPSHAGGFRHYGHNVQILINKAIEMEDGPKKEGFILVIGSYMKMAYKTWNKEQHYVSDDIIKQDLFKMSDGKLSVPDNQSLDGLSNANRRKKNENDRSGRNDRRNDSRGGGRNDRRNDSRGGRNDRRSDSRGGGRNDRRSDSRGGRNDRNDRRNDSRGGGRNDRRNDSRDSRGGGRGGYRR